VEGSLWIREKWRGLLAKLPSSSSPPLHGKQRKGGAGAGQIGHRRRLASPSSVSRGGRRKEVAFCHKTPWLSLYSRKEPPLCHFSLKALLLLAI